MAIKEELFSHKQIRASGDIIEMRIWKVDTESHYPEGIRYSLVYVRDGKNIVRFDNYCREGHHFHIKNRKFSYEFIDEWKLIEDFINKLNSLGISI